MRAIGLLLSAALLAVGAAPVRLRQAAAAPAWAMQMRVDMSYDVGVVTAHAQPGAWCWASVQYDSGGLRTVNLTGQPADSTGLIVWSWSTDQGGLATANVTCTWHGAGRSAAYRFGLTRIESVQNNGSPPIASPPHSKVILRWASNGFIAADGISGKAFTARGAFDLNVALAPVDPHESGRLLAIGIQTTAGGGRGDRTGVVSVNTLITQSYHFTDIDCSRLCSLVVDGAENMSGTILITQPL